MSADADAILDDLLSRWHSWQRGDKGVRGFNRKALLIGDTRAMRVQYESQLERQDEEHDALQCRAIDFAVSKMLEPWKSAIYMLARNLYTGVFVWESPRLPQNKADRVRIVFEARRQITRLLLESGVMCEALT